MASAPLGKGDHHRNDTALQDPSTRWPFVQSLGLREVATLELRKAMNERHVRRMFGQNDQCAKCQVRVGDCAAFHSPRAEKDGGKNEARRFEPGEVIHISGATRHLICLGGIYPAPLRFVKVYLPKGVEQRLERDEAGVEVGLAPMGPVAPEKRGSEDATAAAPPSSLPKHSPASRDVLLSDSCGIPSLGGDKEHQGGAHQWDFIC